MSVALPEAIMCRSKRPVSPSFSVALMLRTAFRKQFQEILSSKNRERIVTPQYILIIIRPLVLAGSHGSALHFRDSEQRRPACVLL
jgi:hypothetical protein